MSESKSQSPLPPKKPTKVEIQLSFYDALPAVIEGKHITRVEWNNPEEYCLLKDTYLMVYRLKAGDPKPGFHNWIVSEGDLLALDWKIV